MFDVVSLDWYEILGRGRVANVASPLTFRRDENPLIGQVVRIDGEPFYVLGVESFAMPLVSVGDPIGLLVKALA